MDPSRDAPRTLARLLARPEERSRATVPDVFTVQLGSLTVRCGKCGARYDLNGTIRAVGPETDAVVNAEQTIDGPCQSCPSPGGGEELPDVTAAE